MLEFGQDTLKTRQTLSVGGKAYEYYSLPAAQKAGIGDISRLPFSLKILLENLLRWEDGRTVTTDDVKALARWLETRSSTSEIAYRPARVLMQDLTGVPAVADLAAMRDAMRDRGGDTAKINPLSPVDLVVDHSVMIDHSGSPEAAKLNVALEFSRNQERYEFLRWGQEAFDNFRVVPPGTGICHQINLEYLSQVVWTGGPGGNVAYPDTLVGTDSHTTMVNGLAVLGWGVGGIEAEAAMLGQPISMVVPEVVGFRMTGRPSEGVTATDIVLRIVEMLRQKGVVGKFVEFCGPALNHLALADRATIGNMAPEYGATCGFFPIDAETIRYLKFSARDDARIALVEAYAKAQGMWRGDGTPEPLFTDMMELDLSEVVPALAGPKRPQDRVALTDAVASFAGTLKDAGFGSPRTFDVAGADYQIADGHVAIAAITSCTNTSNPSVMMGAGLLAKKAVEKGLTAKPWVKTSLAPGSQVVADYLTAGGVQGDLDALGFNVVGFGCTTCIGNSGPLKPAVVDAIENENLLVCAVLSGNRNFEGRVHQYVKANYLASPPLVVAYAIAGTMTHDMANDPLGEDADGNPVYLRDIWPSNAEISAALETALTPDMFRARYADVFTGTEDWRAIRVPQGDTYAWNPGSTYVQKPPFFEIDTATPAVADITGARALAMLGDSVTTDHISPAGAIAPDGPAAGYLKSHQVRPVEFNSFGSRRGNHEVMMRGTFANIRIRNRLAPDTEGGYSTHAPTGEVMPIYEVAERYAGEGTPLVVFGGKEYGTGSSRDWAAKGTRLLGVKAVIVESFERIHRSNLVGMGLLPLQFKGGQSAETLGLDGSETYDITGVAGGITPGMEVTLTIRRADGASEQVPLLCRIDTLDEVEYYKARGILPYVLDNLSEAK